MHSILAVIAFSKFCSSSFFSFVAFYTNSLSCSRPRFQIQRRTHLFPVHRHFQVSSFVHRFLRLVAVQYSDTTARTIVFQFQNHYKPNQTKKTSVPRPFQITAHSIHSIPPIPHTHSTSLFFFFSSLFSIKHFFHLVSGIPSTRFNGGGTVRTTP